MLKIRPEQIVLFSQTEALKFEDWTLAHVKRFFPKQYSAAGETGIRQRIRDGIKRAAGYGITSKRDVCKFIDLVVFLGPDFESDPAFPRALEILKGPRSPAKMAHLSRYVESVLRSVL